MKALAYVRVCTGRQGDSGAGLAAQRAAILVECQRRGWAEADVRWVEEVASAKSAKRPRLEEALAALRAGEAGVLIVSKLDRLGRSLLDVVSIMQIAQREGWVLIALDSPIDLSTPAGEAVAGVLAVFGQLERRLIGERTRDGLAVKRAEGVRLGRPPALPDDVRSRIRAEREEGKTLRAIAAALNDDHVATAHGGKAWYPSSVRAVLTSRP